MILKIQKEIGRSDDSRYDHRLHGVLLVGKGKDCYEVAEINKDLRKNPEELGYHQHLWDGKLLSHHLKEKYSLLIGVRQAQRLFHKLGFSRRKPRPVLSRSDFDDQEAFKKTH